MSHFSHTPPFPFTVNVYNSLNPDFSNFLVETYPDFFNNLFEKYQIIYGFNPHYIIKKHFLIKDHEDHKEEDSPNKIERIPCKISQDIQGKSKFHPFH